MPTDDILHFAGSVEIQASADGSKTTPRVEIVGYTGGMMNVPGWGSVAVELQGLDIAGRVAILSDHDATLRGIVGHGQAGIVAGQLVVRGELPQVTEAAKQIVELAKGGFAFQASVGVQPIKREHITAGSKATVNGKTITAGEMGFTLIRSGTLKEISIVALGADSDTSVAIAAHSKGPKMSEDTNTVTDPAANLQSIQTTWQKAKFHDDGIKAQAQDVMFRAASGAISVGDYEHEMLAMQLRDRELKIIRDGRPKAPEIHASNHDISSDVLEAALLCHLGHEDAATKMLGDQPTQTARKSGLHSLHDIMRAGLYLERGDVPLGRNEMIHAAFSTNTIPGILGNAANKISVAAYNAVPSVARVIARKLSANDFKTHTGYRLTGDATLKQLSPAGEIKHGTLGEGSFSFKVDTFARMFGLSRTDIVNDDLGKFEEVPRLLGRGSATKLEQLFWTLVLANTGSFFAAGNNNYISGTDSALSITGLTNSVTALRQLVDSNGDPISITPKFLVVPPELEAVADQLFASTNVVYGGDTAIPDSNPFKGKYQPQVSPHLSNSNYPGYSATAWYLFGDPGDVAAFGIAYLSGAENPTIEQADSDFNKLGIQFRGYHDFGVCQVDPNGAVMSKGTT